VRRGAVQRWSRRGLRLLALAVGLLAGFVLLSALLARTLPDLEPWHRDVPSGEFRAGDLDEHFGLAEYLALEEELMKQLPHYHVPPEERSRYVRATRYIPGGPGDPGTFEHDWNRTTELDPPEVRGGVLLLHGCSDSPYSLRAVAEIFHARGFYTLSLRLPGHGTVPAALKEADWRDWEAAARLGARHVASRLEADQPFYVCGYSVGGALSIRLAIDAIEEEKIRKPDRLYLFSPCLGVSAFARLALVDQALAFIPYFEKSVWLNVSPEYDPFKYVSFAEQAGYETWKLTRDTRERWSGMVDSGEAAAFPPVLCFQSAVDSTILTSPTLSFMEDLPAGGSELVVFDVNHASRLDGYFKPGGDLLTRGIDGPPRDFTWTVVTNISNSTQEVMARRRPAGSPEIDEEPLEARWPDDMISLGHVAIPFPPSDPNYGEAPASSLERRLTIGSVVARGEWGALKVSSSELMRVRHNPFFAYLQRRIEETIP
jgi:pimeloyl-ACP methyl ester carboxylesterase